MKHKRIYLSLFFFFAVITGVNMLANDFAFKNLSTEPKHEAAAKKVFKKYADTNYDESLAVDVASAIEVSGMNKFGDILIAQIALESSCVHQKKGKLVGSKTGAKGLCQITPTTAFQKVRYELKDSDIALMKKLGANPPNWSRMEYSKSIFGKKFVPKRNRKLVIAWLEDPKNSIALWIVLMKGYETKYGIDGALVAYHDGEGGLKKVKSPSKHWYVKKTISIINKENI